MKLFLQTQENKRDESSPIQNDHDRLKQKTIFKLRKMELAKQLYERDEVITMLNNISDKAFSTVDIILIVVGISFALLTIIMTAYTWWQTNVAEKQVKRAVDAAEKAAGESLKALSDYSQSQTGIMQKTGKQFTELLNQYVTDNKRLIDIDTENTRKIMSDLGKIGMEHAKKIDEAMNENVKKLVGLIKEAEKLKIDLENIVNEKNSRSEAR